MLIYYFLTFRLVFSGLLCDNLREMTYYSLDNPIEAESPVYNAGASNAIIACGALAKEIIFLINSGALAHIALYCLPAKLHNAPNQIIPALSLKIAQIKHLHNKIYIGYADCGTGGLLDKFCQEHDLTRIAGAHCYAFFAGLNKFDDIMNRELGSFFLTDFLTRHFDSLIIKGMGLNRNPIIKDMMFSHYKKLVYLAQSDDEELTAMAKKHAQYLGLSFERIATGYGMLNDFIHTANQA